MNDRLAGIDTFVQAVEAGSFALAAQRLRVSRSAVGKAIAKLEQRLGVRLFHRTTRRQSLTEEGQAFYERCLRVISELDAAEAVLDGGRRAPRGRLRVSVPVLFGRRCVAPVLFRLAQAHPELTVEISFSDSVVDLLEEGFDLAVRIGKLPDSASLAARRLGAQSMAICASPAYLDTHGRPRCLSELSRHTGIVYSRPGYDKAWPVRDLDGKVHEVRIDARLRLDDVQAIADAAVAGAGLAWLPCWLLAGYVRDGLLELVMDCERVVASDIHAVWPQSRYMPSKTRAAIDALVEAVPQFGI